MPPCHGHCHLPPHPYHDLRNNVGPRQPSHRTASTCVCADEARGSGFIPGEDRVGIAAAATTVHGEDEVWHRAYATAALV